MSPKFTSDVKVISAFLKNSCDNWRNAMYIECSVCKYHKESGCGDFLFIPEATGRPVLLPLHDAELLFGLIDKSECLAIQSNVVFEQVYNQWFKKHCTEHSDQCPLLFCSKHYLSLYC